MNTCAAYLYRACEEDSLPLFFCISPSIKIHSGKIFDNSAINTTPANAPAKCAT